MSTTVPGLNGHALKRMAHQNQQATVDAENMLPPHDATYNRSFPAYSGNNDSPLWGAYMEPPSTSTSTSAHPNNVTFTAGPASSPFYQYSPESNFSSDEHHRGPTKPHPSPETDYFPKIQNNLTWKQNNMVDLNSYQANLISLKF